MRIISRISIRFDPREDRLRLTMIDRGDETLVLWLTLRLANALVGGLLRAVEGLAISPEAVAGGQGAGKAAHQFWAQTKAEMEMAANAQGIRQSQAGVSELVDRVALRRSPGEGRFVLELHWRGGSCAAPIDEIYLRQILKVLHRNYTLAGWSPAAVWPVWLGDEAHRSVLRTNEIN